jgi:CRP-like cAMP-binding protein
MDGHLVTLAQKSVKERLTGTLIYLEETFGTDEDGSLRLHLSLEELAGMVGTATESCIRLLSELNKSDLIELLGKRIKIVDKNKLRRLSE